ncbi:NAD(P)H-dependent oxidoreductase [Spongiactinospora sp. TRM90649]|uniref:NADPH-dependent FMN reductase n=1 Tax=Spongiactinospora sp. TRM90649 TaxID=3031114 RepID=UPI0023F7A4AC|nr:NAD(P)H-dependent oxidoreductase [Spongiactinospora sp. TRM90649]MDF5754388.1 NAD(P)H-dependent oxidoreductase [Spongiactinospora sp. TRM90649]
MLKVGIILGSTRPGRNGEVVAQWVRDLAAKRGDADYKLVDLADYGLGNLDEPQHPAMGNYRHEHTKRWSATIAPLDAFVFVTPEYNNSYPGALKNALDFLHAEWANKAAGFVGYGVDGAPRAISHLRHVLGLLSVATVSGQVGLSLGTDFAGGFSPAPSQEDRLNTLLDQLLSWGTALRPLRG